MRNSFCLILSALLLLALPLGAEESKPLFKEFMGVNGHTVQFKPELYKATCLQVRDYHPIEWDFGNDTSYATKFPEARNRVDWKQVYGSWKKSGYNIDVSALFDTIKAKTWKDPVKDPYTYGLAFAKYFGPSHENLVSSFEIGNEPGSYSDSEYRTVFENMAKGLREGDPKLQIVTCNCINGKSHKYAKSLTCVEGLEDSFDVLNIHTYAEVEGWPTWKRSFPEDSTIKYLTDVEGMIAWRDKHAPKKPIWITEFGWDASTKTPPKTGDFAKWQGSTETQQAQWLVRSFMVFSKMPVARAYIYFFDDKDQPQVHGSSGLTRNFQPKPSFHAVAFLLNTLGDYRFSKVIQEKAGEAYAYEFSHSEDAGKRIWAVWSPTGSGHTTELTLPLNGLKVTKAEQMPLAPGAVPAMELKEQNGSVVIPVSESPVFIRLSK